MFIISHLFLAISIETFFTIKQIYIFGFIIVLILIIFIFIFIEIVQIFMENFIIIFQQICFIIDTKQDYFI